MSQRTLTDYFHARKRPAVEDLKSNSAKKILLQEDAVKAIRSAKIGRKETTKVSETQPETPRTIEKTENGVKSTKSVEIIPSQKAEIVQESREKQDDRERPVTPPNVLRTDNTNEELQVIKKKLSKSSKLAELKASINRFKEADKKLEQSQKQIAQALSPQIKPFKTLEFDVILSPQKILSPEKAYLSPKKDVTPSNVRRNLLGAFSPTKKRIASLLSNDSLSAESSSSKSGLKLPFKYRSLAETFRAIDTVVQLMHNRHETITFSKLKPSVEQLLKKNLLLKHLAQIKALYPECFELKQEKMKQFGTREEKWELLLVPKLDSECMNGDAILSRRRAFYEALLNKMKDYHEEFLLNLTPPIRVSKQDLTRWHPEFDLEKVPDVEAADVPQPPEEKVHTAKEVMEKARQMFSCNSRMEQAMARVAANRELQPKSDSNPPELLKNIPAALLEKVRQKQAAKALLNMTRSSEQEKQIEMYNRLPELARFARNLYVSEKKNVLPLDSVLDKLLHSLRSSLMTRSDLEAHLKLIAKELPDWLVFYKVRNAHFLKLIKDADVSAVLNKLERLAKEKRDT